MICRRGSAWSSSCAKSKNLSVEETADFLGIPQATVKTRLHRARRLLRQNLDEQLAPALADAFRFDGMCLRANGRQGLGTTRTFIAVSRLTGSRDYQVNDLRFVSLHTTGRSCLSPFITREGREGVNQRHRLAANNLLPQPSTQVGGA